MLVGRSAIFCKKNRTEVFRRPRRSLRYVDQRAPPSPPISMLGAKRKPVSNLQNFCRIGIDLRVPLFNIEMGGAGGFPSRK